MRVRRRTAIGIAAIVAVVAGASGIAIGTYRRPALELLRSLKPGSVTTADTPRGASSGHVASRYERSAEGVAGLFTGPLVAGQLFGASSTLEDVARRVDEYFVDAKRFETAFAALAVERGTRQGRVFTVEYDLGRRYTSYAYVLESARAPSRRVSCAALIVPGTGDNQSTAIVDKDRTNPQGGLAEVATRYCDTYVLLKPNQDVIAIHDGRRKLSFDAIYTHLINRGGSYSARYVIDSMALAKHLERTYDALVVLGLSQGGQAALLNALQSSPAAAVIASGYSILDERLTVANADQIVIPGALGGFRQKLKAAMQAGRTQYLFTYGRAERGTYRIEAEDADTCRFLADTRRARCTVHDGGHAIPLDAVDVFLRQQTGQ